MAERKITVTANPTKAQSVLVSPNSVQTYINATPDTSLYYSTISKKWAVEMGRLVNGEDYSAKHYAGQAAQSVEEAQNFAEQAENSKDELLNDTGFVAVKDNLDSVITAAVNIEDINTNAENIEAIKNASTIALGKADRDLSNLTEQGEKHFLNKSQITNCLLEVPQRIKLELKDGVLTLKAGSKVIVPNGVDVFNEVVIQQDISLGDISFTQQHLMIFVNAKGTGFGYRPVASCFSGTSDSNTKGTNYYNTSTNIIMAHNSASDIQMAFPIAEVTSVSGVGFTSVNQIFNGFGCIGSHIWVDKGVKILVADGFNEDETIKNEEIVTPNVIVARGIVSGTRSDFLPFLRRNQITNQLQIYPIPKSSFLGELDYVPPISATFQYYFNKTDMKWYQHEASQTSWTHSHYYIISPSMAVEDSLITEFKPYKPFRAADDQEVVKKSGDTMTGILTAISSPHPFVAQSSLIDITQTPTTSQAIGYDFRDKNGTRIGWFGVVNNIDGGKYFQMQNLGGVDGFVFPMCTTKATTTSTASGRKVATVIQNYVNGTSWYRVWSDGWIEQGGRVTSASITNVTFLKAFSNTNYTVAVSQNGSASASVGRFAISSYQTNSFTIHGSLNSAILPACWYACGY